MRRTVRVPQSAVGRIIGRRGLAVRELQCKSGARIQVDHTPELRRRPHHPDDGDDDADGGNGNGGDCEDGRQRDGATVAYDGEDDCRTVTITGAEGSVSMAEAMIAFLAGGCATGGSHDGSNSAPAEHFHRHRHSDPPQQQQHLRQQHQYAGQDSFVDNSTMRADLGSESEQRYWAAPVGYGAGHGAASAYGGYDPLGGSYGPPSPQQQQPPPPPFWNANLQYPSVDVVRAAPPLAASFDATAATADAFDPSDYYAVQTRVLPCERSDIGHIIGRRGGTINDLERRSGCEIQIDQRTCEVRITGTMRFNRSWSGGGQGVAWGGGRRRLLPRRNGRGRRCTGTTRVVWGRDGRCPTRRLTRNLSLWCNSSRSFSSSRGGQPPRRTVGCTTTM